MTEIKCISTKKSISNDVGSVTFPCPNCGSEIVTRSKAARQTVAPYKCNSCGFMGP